MLTITIEPFSVFDETTESFIGITERTKLKLEYSLYAIAQWEKKYKKVWLESDKPKNPYMKQNNTSSQRTEEEMRYFIKCMITNIEFDEIDDTIFYGLTHENAQEIADYLADSQGVNIKIPEIKKRKGSKGDPFPMTSDRIYAWMFETQIPLSAEFWNINRLLTVIQIVNYDNTPDDMKKGNKQVVTRDTAEEYRKINDKRLKELGTKG